MACSWPKELCVELALAKVTGQGQTSQLIAADWLQTQGEKVPLRMSCIV